MCCELHTRGDCCRCALVGVVNECVSQDARNKQCQKYLLLFNMFLFLLYINIQTVFIATKWMVMSHEQNAGRNHDIEIGNKSFLMVEVFRYLGWTLTNQNSIHETIKSSLKLVNTYYNSLQNLLFSNLLSKNVMIAVYRTIILPVFCMGVKFDLSYLGRNINWGCWGRY
jgi:hypothetical protein